MRFKLSRFVQDTYESTEYAFGPTFTKDGANLYFGMRVGRLFYGVGYVCH